MTTDSTGLHELLQAERRRAHRRHGLALDYCVKATALDGVDLGYDDHGAAPSDGARRGEPGDGVAAEADLAAAGVTVTLIGQA